jgi:hypothetical protein
MQYFEKYFKNLKYVLEFLPKIIYNGGHRVSDGVRRQKDF